MGKAARQKRAARAAKAGAAGFTQAEVDAVTRASHASGRNNPRAVRDAFLPTPIRIGSLEVAPLTTGRFMLLEQIESPFVRDARPGDKNEPSNIEVLEAVYAMTQPVAPILDLLARGREAFRREVMLFADDIPMPDLPGLGAAITAQFQRAQSTLIGSPASSGEDAGAGAAEKKSSPASAISPASRPNPTGSGGH